MFFRSKAPEPEPTPTPQPEPRASFFTTDTEAHDDFLTREQRLENLGRTAFPVRSATVLNTTTMQRETVAMDSSGGGESVKAVFNLNQVGIPEVQANWYGMQGFIGYQLCALIAQHWFVSKACLMPARDAIRKGYTLTVNDGTEVQADVLDAMAKANKRYKLNKKLVEFVKFGRVFGIRVALCVVDSTDPDYYVKPFNPDSVTPGSYRGITQIDPYWIVPELTNVSASDPGSLDFYEPTYWIVGNKRYHKSHLIIMRGPEVADILKPSYLYGGLSIPQIVYERVYAAERTANEAPQLALTKRSMIFYTDTAKALANYTKFVKKLIDWAFFRDNYGVKVADKEADKIEQHDTSLADLDAVIMSQFQLACGAVNVPSTKMMGTTPKGFNASGTYEEDSYHEELESIQTDDMEPLVDRHMVCVIRSDIAPRFGIKPFGVDCTWNPLDSLSSEEAATVNKTKAETDKVLVEIGAIDGGDVRKRLSADETSGHSGLPTLEDGDAPEATDPDAQA